MAESKLISLQEGNLCEIINDRINWYHKLITFFATYEVSSRDAICLLTFLYTFFKISYSKVKSQVNYSGDNLWFIFFILKPVGVYVQLRQLKHGMNDLSFIFIILKPCGVYVWNPVEPQWGTSLKLT